MWTGSAAAPLVVGDLGWAWTLVGLERLGGMARCEGSQVRNGEGACVTKRDLRIVSWVDGLGGASLAQVRRRFGMGRTQGYRRARVLQEYGLLFRLHPLVGVPALYVTGRRIVRPWAFEHVLLLADLVVDLELDGRAVLGEVGIRRQGIDGAHSETAALTSGQADVVGACERIPDAIELRPDGALVAYEIEIASKGRARRERILAAYGVSEYAAVEWIVPGHQLARLLCQEIAETGLDDFMRVTHGWRIELPTLADRAEPLTTEEIFR